MLDAVVDVVLHAEPSSQDKAVRSVTDVELHALPGDTLRATIQLNPGLALRDPSSGQMVAAVELGLSTVDVAGQVRTSSAGSFN